MNYEEFICHVQAKVKEKMGNEVQVERRRVIKNNGVELEGISIMEEKQKISPVIYMEDYYHIYEKGGEVPEIVKEILRVYSKSRAGIPMEADFYTCFDKVQSRLACRLVNYEQNENLLFKVPHIRCLDLALVFYYALEDGEMGSGTILVYNSHMDMWQITKEQLCEIARKNTPRIFPYEFKKMRELLEENLEEGGEILEEGDELPMYVLSNEQRHFGAVNILYDSILSKIGSRLGDDFYILPSSIHECIIVPSKVRATREELKNMVWEINRTQVLPEEVLSDNVYFYKREEHRLSL